MVKHGKMKGVVLYKLENDGGSPKAISLLKYDYAHSDEGGKHKKSSFQKMDFVSGIGKSIENYPPEMYEKNKIGGYKTIEGDGRSHVIYGCDSEGICYAVLTGNGYPSRVAINALEELYNIVQKEIGNTILQKNDNTQLNQYKKHLKEFCKKYKSVEDVDKAHKVLEQCEQVKGQMQNNITGMIGNQEKASELKGKTDTLVEQANVYKTRTKKLKKIMWWKDKKQTCLLLFVILLVIALFLLPVLLNLPFIQNLLSGGGGASLYSGVTSSKTSSIFSPSQT